MRWLCFRVMFGAGLIKIRGDRCWRDLTCLNYHYETQPMPNPLSWFFHWAPEWTRKGGVLFNHFAELIVPFGYFLPQPAASIAGIITIVFQALIFASGNLAWLNLLTAVLALSAIDDRVFSVFLTIPAVHEPSTAFRILVWTLTICVIALSFRPVRNLLSPRQVMNTIYNRFHFVGTYGAFGSITRPRYEVVIEGTEEAVLTSSTKWREYEFKGKPGDPRRLPPQIAPYHLRLDWLMWFAAFSSYQQHPWFLHLLGELLNDNRAVLGLLRKNPFPEKPPRYVRALRYEYHLATPAGRREMGIWWTRRYAGLYFPPVSLQQAPFRELLERQGWIEREYTHQSAK
jgi:lipase maturation factor